MTLIIRERIDGEFFVKTRQDCSENGRGKMDYVINQKESVTKIT